MAGEEFGPGGVGSRLDKRGRPGDPAAVERRPSSQPEGGDGDPSSGRRREVLVTAWPEQTPEPDAPRPRAPSRPYEPPMPQRIGRFRIRRLLGSGGMSVVYEAYDDRLDRTVALKLLRERGGKRRQARLQREAQALARLSHPNVVEVYETGSHQGRAFLVMERLPGQPLQRWLAAERRSVPAVVTTFVAAGRGLAAAHAQGLVHRDFKPSNVLVGADGRVRVFDFGLAAPSGPASEDSVGTGPYPVSSGPHAIRTAPQSSASASHPVLGELELHGEGYEEIWESALTRTGAMLGTPAYMSPEQYEGRPATAQSDQFALCVALYEALYGEHPFVERQAWDLLPKHVMEGRLREPPRGNTVPAGLQRVLVRGLSVQPTARWPTMDALLVALERALGQRRRVAWVAGVAALAGVALGLGLWLGREPPATGLCTGAEDKLAAVWGPQHHTRVHAAMLATGVPHATDVWYAVEAGLDAYAEEWIEGHRRACQAFDGGASDEAMDGRMACLERRRRALGAFVAVLEAADAAVVHQAIGAVSQLEAIAPCDGAGGPALAAAPSDPELAARVEGHRETLARAEAYERAGQYHAGLELALRVAAAADGLGYAPLQAEAQLQVGQLQRDLGAHDEAERALERAYFLGQALEHDALAREAVTQLAFVVAELQRRPDEGLRWLEHARAAAEREGGDKAWADYLDTEGSVLWAAHRKHEALLRFEEALPLFEREWGPNHPQVARVLDHRGLLLGELDRPDLALRSIERSLAIREAAFGPEHPEVGRMLDDLGLTLVQAGRTDEAIASFWRAHALRLRVLGPDHPDVAKSLVNLASVALERGELDAAAEHAAAALVIHERAYGADSVEAALVHALAGRVQLAQRRDDEALVGLTRAVRTLEQALGADRIELVEPLSLLAEAERRRARLDPAVRHVERALALGRAQGLLPRELAYAQLLLARVQWDRGQPARARVAAEAARQAYAGLSEAQRRQRAREVGELEAWWAAHGEP
jgi:eukaryotic-like serine/threonine-protein kinase